MKTRTIPTPSGEMPVYVFPAGDAPLVVLLMDAIGIRGELRELASELNALGYTVLLPNLYYREGLCEDMDFSTPEGHQRVMQLYAGLSHAMVRDDVEALLKHSSGSSVGLLGFCMGGANALVLAGAFPDKISAAAAIHPGGIVTDQPDSPHRMARKAQGRLYIAVADADPYATSAQVDELEQSLRSADVDYRLEVYRGAHHGFAFASLPSYNAEAQSRYWEASCELFETALK